MMLLHSKFLSFALFSFCLGLATADDGHRKMDIGDGLVVTVIKESKDCLKKAEIGDHLSVHYVGRLDDENGKEFDASRKNGRVFQFQLGAGQVSHLKKKKSFLFCRANESGKFANKS